MHVTWIAVSSPASFFSQSKFVPSHSRDPSKSSIQYSDSSSSIRPRFNLAANSDFDPGPKPLAVIRSHSGGRAQELSANDLRLRPSGQLCKEPNYR